MSVCMSVCISVCLCVCLQQEECISLCLYVCLQQEDLTSLGRVVLTLANNSVHCLHNLTASMLFVQRAYSADLNNLIMSVSVSLCLSLFLGCLQLLEILEISWNLKFLLEILEISLNFVDDPGKSL